MNPDLDLDQDQLLETVQQVIKLTQSAGANAAEASISASRGFSVSARKHEVETVEHTNSHSLALTVYFNTQKGTTVISDFSTESIKQTVDAAVNIAKYTSPDTYAGLAPKELMATNFPDLEIDRPWDLDIPQAIDIAIACENAMREEPHIVNTEGATVETQRNTVCYTNSHGFAHAYSGTQHSISAIAIAGDDKTIHRDYWYTVSREASRLEPHQTVGKTAAVRASKRLGARKPNTCKTPVLFAAPVARSLIGLLIRAVSGGALYREASFLCNTLNQRIFPEFIQIHEQPHLRGSIGGTLFDDEGVAVHEHPIVENGVLKNYVLDSYSARKLNMKTTGNAGGISNVAVTGNAGNLDTLLAEMDTGLLVTELIGSGTNLLTGDYSYGAVGFWVENGNIQYPVEEVTIAGNLKSIFMNIAMLGNDIDERGNIRCGSILIKEMMLAGD